MSAFQEFALKVDKKPLKYQVRGGEKKDEKEGNTPYGLFSVGRYAFPQGTFPFDDVSPLISCLSLRRIQRETICQEATNGILRGGGWSRRD